MRRFRGLYLDAAALGELALAEPSLLYLPGGVESEVGAPRGQVP